jgi:hypothetical protein
MSATFAHKYIAMFGVCCHGLETQRRCPLANVCRQSFEWTALSEDDCRNNLYRHLTSSVLHAASFADPGIDMNKLVSDVDVVLSMETWTPEEPLCIRNHGPSLSSSTRGIGEQGRVGWVQKLALLSLPGQQFVS